MFSFSVHLSFSEGNLSNLHTPWDNLSLFSQHTIYSKINVILPYFYKSGAKKKKITCLNMTWVKPFSLSGWMAFSDEQFSPVLCLVPGKFYCIRVLFYFILPYSEVILKAKAVSAWKVMQDCTRPLEVVCLILCVKQRASHFWISP